MKSSRVFWPFLKKEVKMILKSNIYLLIMLLDVVISILASILTITGSIDEKHIVLQISLIPYFTNLYNFFVIFMIAPAISISDERENGTWDIINVKVGNDTSPILAKIASQLAFAFILIVVSTLTFMLIYLSYFSTFPSVTLTEVSKSIITLQGNFTGTFKTVNTTSTKVGIPDSLISTVEMVIVAFLTVIPVVMISVLSSKFFRTKINSIIFVIGYYMAMIALFTLLSIKNTSAIFELKALIDSLNPQFLFTVTSTLFRFANITLITSYGNIVVSYATAQAPLFSYFAYIILIVTASLIFVFFPKGGEILTWLRKRKQ